MFSSFGSDVIAALTSMIRGIYNNLDSRFQVNIIDEQEQRHGKPSLELYFCRYLKT